MSGLKRKKKSGPTHPKKKDQGVGFDPKFDEDVDDDIAFDSDDDRQYGDFFAKVKENTKREKKKGAKKGDVKGGGLDDTFNDLYDPGNDSDGDDDGEFDLSDMLNDEPSKKKSKKVSATKKPAVEIKAGKLKQASARDVVTREGETLFAETSTKTTAGAKLSRLVKEVGGAGDKRSKADEKIAKRLTKAVQEKETIFDADVDEEVKEQAGRTLTREAVQKEGKKWAPVLRELKRNKNVQFPLPGGEESASIPQTLGAIASGADPAAQKKAPKTPQPKKRNRDGIEEEEHGKVPSKIERSKNMTSTMANLLTASGLSGRVQNPSAGSAEAKAVEKKLLTDREYVALNDISQQQQDGEEQGETRAPVKIGYVRQLKSMMQYELSKRRRLNKIKSKTYRRILRKEKDREVQEKERALELNNPQLAVKRKTEKMEKMRAIERATQKHKNTSKWIKHVKRYSKFDDETRDAVHDQYHEHARLMAKMEEDAAAQLKEDAADSSSEDEEKRVDRLLATDNHTLRQAGLKSTLWGDADVNEQPAVDMSDPTAKARYELQQMNFMQRAKERHDAEDEDDHKKLLEDIQRHKEGKAPLHADTLAGGLDDMDEETRAQLAKEDSRAMKISLKGHSVLTRGQGAKDKREVEAKTKAAQAKIDAEQAARNLNTGRKTFTAGEAKSANLAALPSKGLFGQQQEEEFDEEEEDADAEEEEEDDAESSDEGDAVVGAPQQPKRSKGKSLVLGGSSVVPEEKKRKQVKSVATKSIEASGGAAGPTTVGNGTEGDTDAQQDYLVARAFAGDNVDEEFLKLKEQQVETIMKPQDPNASLPGWGEWGGEEEGLNKAHKKRVESSELSRKIEKSTLMKSRVDANMDHVIVNHDVDLVPSGYTLKMVPRPFANAQEFQRHMRQPMGPEWNTSTTFAAGVKPRIETKKGTIIDPLSKRTGTRKAKTTMRKKRNRGTEEDTK